MIRAVLFDYDGVLVDSMRYHVQAWQEVFRSYGVEVEDRVVYLNEGIGTYEMAMKLTEAFGLDLDEAELRRLVQRKQGLYRRLTRARMLPEAVALVRQVRDRGLATGLVTGSASRDLDPVLSPEQRTLFDVVVTSDDVKRGKPAPDPYLRAASTLNLSPAECLVIENAPMGIRAAKEAGMPVVAIESTLPAADLAEANLIFHNLEELRQNLDNVLRAMEAVTVTEADG